MLKFPRKEEMKNERKEGEKKGWGKKEGEKGTGIEWDGLLEKEKKWCKK